MTGEDSPRDREDEEGGVETRKLQLLAGGKTFGVTLPKAWVQAMGLQAGNEVEMRRQPDGAMLVTPRRDARPKTRERRVEIATQDADEVLRLLTSLYLSNCTVMVLVFRVPVTPEMRGVVFAACERLRGLQMMEDVPGRIVLQDLSDPNDLPVDHGLRMMHLHARRMLVEADRAYGGPLPEDAIAAVRHSEAELDRLLLLLLKQHNYLLRHLSFERATGMTAEESLSCMFVAQYLERVGDYAMRAIEAACAPKPPWCPCNGLPQHRRALQGAARLLDEAMTAFERGDSAMANRVIAEATELARDTRDKAFDAFLHAARVNEAHPGVVYGRCFSVMESAERVVLYTKSIAESAMNRALVQPRCERI